MKLIDFDVSKDSGVSYSHLILGSDAIGALDDNCFLSNLVKYYQYDCDYDDMYHWDTANGSYF